MHPILKNMLAVVAGSLLGSVVNMSIIMVGMEVMPVPEGVDMEDMDKFAENLKLLEPQNFIAPWVAHALGTFVGAWIAAWLAASRKMAFAFGIGGLFLLGGVTMVAMYGGPIWFAVLDIVGAYLPMAYLGGMLAIPKKADPT